ncbi:MAG: hypothetical protein AB1705_25395 [Verrucomicrobiota bacterium]
MKLPLLLAVLLAGCNAGETEHASGESHDTHEVELYHEGKGVRLPDELRRTLGVETVEVAEKSVTPRLTKQAQVFRAATASQPAIAVAWLSEAEAKPLHPGQSVELRGLTTNTITGALIRLENHAPGQTEALIEFAGASKQFPVGATLTATFASDRALTALAVPESAVIHGAAGAFVFAVNGDHFIRTPVKLAVTEAGWSMVTDGLYTGDAVVTKAADSLWLIELCALKGGSPCCPVPTKPSGK